VLALPALGLVGKARLKQRLIFRRQRRLLAKPQRLARIPLNAIAARPMPLAGPVGIFAFIKGLRAARAHADRDANCNGTCDDTDRARVRHWLPPVPGFFFSSKAS